MQITKCSLDDLLMSLKVNKMALNSAVYMEDVDGKFSLREVLPIKAAHPTAFSGDRSSSHSFTGQAGAPTVAAPGQLVIFSTHQ